MTFTAENFEDLLNFYKDNCKIQSNAKDVYQTLTEISKSDNDDSKPIIENDSIFLFNLDNLCYNSYLSKSGHISKDLPSSVDALYFSNTMFLGKVENFMGLNFLNMILTIYNHYYNNLAYFKILY